MVYVFQSINKFENIIYVFILKHSAFFTSTFANICRQVPDFIFKAAVNLSFWACPIANSNLLPVIIARYISKTHQLRVNTMGLSKGLKMRTTRPKSSMADLDVLDHYSKLKLGFWIWLLETKSNQMKMSGSLRNGILTRWWLPQRYVSKRAKWKRWWCQPNDPRRDSLNNHNNYTAPHEQLVWW